MKNLLAGLGGAIALNILHESLKKTNTDMPRLDLLGEEALQKGLHFFGTEISSEDNLYLAALGGDLFTNTIYFSRIGAGGKDQIWSRAIGLGLTAGIGALLLPKPLGLDPRPSARNPKVSAITVAYFLTGALITAGILNAIKK